MKNQTGSIFVSCLVLVTVAATSLQSFEISYEAGESVAANPVDQGWRAANTSDPGVDSNEDGRIDLPANVGPVIVDGRPAWQINDQLAGNLARPDYVRSLTQAEIQSMYEHGWVLAFTVKPDEMDIRENGFLGWDIDRASDPGWGIDASLIRAGFWIGKGYPGEFAAFSLRLSTTAPGSEQIFYSSFPLPADEFHEVRCVGKARSTVFEIFVNGYSVGSADISGLDVPGPHEDRILWSAGSSGQLMGTTTWTSIKLSDRDPAELVPSGGLLHRWTFNGHSLDNIGGAHGELFGDARIADGRLVLDGSETGSFMRTPRLPHSLGEKTLVAWVSPSTLNQSGGGILTIEDVTTNEFDSIVFGERIPGQWMAGSEFFNRTPEDNGGAPEVSTGMVMMAIVYRDDNSIEIYRNGERYDPAMPEARGTLRFFEKPFSRVLLGLRHSNAQSTNNSFFHGAIDEARIYGEALDQSDILSLHESGPVPFAGNRIEIQSGTGVLLVNGESVSGEFRGVPFTSAVYGGLCRLTFGGNLEFLPGDYVTGTGDNAVQITVAGNLKIHDGAIIDVSASDGNPGPGGGRGGQSVKGGDRGSGGTGGNGGAGGAGGTGIGVFGSGTGNSGKSGKNGEENGNPGKAGQDGDPGLAGFAGFNAPETAGQPGFVENGGAAGTLGARSLSPGGGGAGGTPHNAKNGGDATANGRSGGSGDLGAPGGRGGDGSVRRGFHGLTGGGGGASGQGGGGGAGGGGGGGGAGGGGGGGGGASFLAGGHAGGNGGAGGHGGRGGDGGNGGAGGRGGHGGGAIEFRVLGYIEAAGDFLATGSSGEPGTRGNQSDNSRRNNEHTDGKGGASGSSAVGATSSGSGGDGSNGGFGGFGGYGGAGGPGGGGAGGTIMFTGAAVDVSSAFFHVDGGANGDFFNGRGDTGRVVFATGDLSAPATKVPGVLETFVGLTGQNPHLHDLSETPFIPDLAGGSDIGGILDNINAWTPGMMPSGLAHNDRLAVARRQIGPGPWSFTFPGYDWLILINLTSQPLPRPVLGAGPGAYTSFLRDGGLASNPELGGSGPVVLDSLPPFAIYATLVPSEQSMVTFGFVPDNILHVRSDLLTVGSELTLAYGGPADRTFAFPVDYPDPVVDLPEGGERLRLAGFGSIKVNLEFPETVSLPAGAGWSVDGLTPVYPSGTVAGGIPPGLQTIRFSRVPGWLPPGPRTITVVPDGPSADQPYATISAQYEKAPVYNIGEIPPRSVGHQKTLGFYVEPGSRISVTEGTADGPIVIGPDGWFSYSPADVDRLPFELTFSSADGNLSQTISVSPLPELPAEQVILSLQPKTAVVPDPAGRDYNPLFRQPVTASLNFQPDDEAFRFVVSGMDVVFDAADPNPGSLFNEINGRRDLKELCIYADKVIIRSPLNLPQTSLHIYARDLIFEGDTSMIMTTPVGVPSNGDAGLAGGDITLHVLNISSDPSSSSRFILNGGAGATGAPGGASGLLLTPFDGMDGFAEYLGGAGVPAGVVRVPGIIGGDGQLPSGYRWLHPMGVRAALGYARDLYYFGLMDEASEIFSEYARLLEVMEDFSDIPALPDTDNASMEFAELRGNAITHRERIADRLDYFGNPAGWVPLLSFETEFLLTSQTIRSAMETLYVSRWIQRSAESLTSAANAMREAEQKMLEDNDRLGEELNDLDTELVDLVQLEAELNQTIDELSEQLKDIEARLLERADANVTERNKVPFWKQALRGLGSIMRVVPVFQPAAGSIGEGLEVVSRVDEQSPLDTVLQAATVAGNYKAASLRTEAEDIRQKANPPQFGPQTRDEAKQEELLQQAGRIGTGVSIMNHGAEAVRGFLQETEAPADEVQAELRRLQASDPQFRGISGRISELILKRQAYIARIVAVQNRLREIPGMIMQNALAARSLNAGASQKAGFADPQVLSILGGLDRNARDRLRRQFYLLAKSYEYRVLRPFPRGDQPLYDPVQVFDKVVDLVEAAAGDDENPTPWALSSDDFRTLQTLFADELQRPADEIIEGYRNGIAESTFDSPRSVTISADDIPGLNDRNIIPVINFADRNLFPAAFGIGEEAHRIASLNIPAINYTLTRNGIEVAPGQAGLNAGRVNIRLIHSGVTRLTRFGQTYLFLHHRDRDVLSSPIFWDFSLDLLTGNIEPVPLSPAEESLLNTLLQSEENNTLPKQRFSRPGAWADIHILVGDPDLAIQSGTTGEVSVTINSMDLEYLFDYYVSSPTQGPFEISLEIEDTQGNALDLDARFFSDTMDVHGRRDGVGRILRSFQPGPVQITPETFYGPYPGGPSGDLSPDGYAFSHWVSQNGGALTTTPNLLGDSVQGNVLNIDADTNKRFIAVYRFVGDAVPATVRSIETATSFNEPGVSAFLVTFTEQVSGVDITDFIAHSPAGPATILSVEKVSDTVWRVRVAGTDIQSLALIDDDSILDSGGNSLGGHGSGNGDFNAGFTGGLIRTMTALGFSDQGFHILITAPAGESWQIQVSTDLKNWETFQSITMESATEVVTDPESINASPVRRFYRLHR